MKNFETKTKMSMEKMPEAPKNKWVNKVKEIAEEFRNKKHDEISIETLHTYGQNLVGIQSWIEGWVSKSRYKRDAWKQRRDEVYEEKYADNKAKSDTIKEAENKTERDMEEIDREILKVEKQYRDARAVLNSCERMSSMIQTLIKSRDNQKYNNFDA